MGQTENWRKITLILSSEPLLSDQIQCFHKYMIKNTNNHILFVILLITTSPKTCFISVLIAPACCQLYTGADDTSVVAHAAGLGRRHDCRSQGMLEKGCWPCEWSLLTKPLHSAHCGKHQLCLKIHYANRILHYITVYLARKRWKVAHLVIKK